MEEKLTGNELEMLYAAADYRRAEIVMNQYFDKVPGNAWKYVRYLCVFYATGTDGYHCGMKTNFTTRPGKYRPKWPGNV